MQEQKRYHQRKLAIIEMIDECDKCIKREQAFLDNIDYAFSFRILDNSTENIKRYERIKQRLSTWLSE